MQGGSSNTRDLARFVRWFVTINGLFNMRALFKNAEERVVLLDAKRRDA